MRKILLATLTGLLLGSYSFGQCASIGCPTISMSGTDTDCYNGANGTATVSVTTLNPYSVSWSTTPISNLTTINSLTAGTYTVIVKDLCTGCSVTGAYVVNSPTPLGLTATIIDVPCEAGLNGQIQLAVTGGTPFPGYTYDWDMDGTGDFDDDQSPFVSTGTHTVVVKDYMGCTITQSFFVDEPQTPVEINYTTIDVDCNGAATGSIDVIMNGSGTPAYSYSWTGYPWTTEDVSGLLADTYEVVVTDDNGCTDAATIIIGEPLAPLASDILLTPNVNVSCFGFSDGIVTTDVSGGTMPYSFEWSNSTSVFSVNSPTLSNIPSDVYNVVVTDFNGCTANSSTTIDSPNELVFASESVQAVECYGESTGAISITVLGGTINYIYAWTNSGGASVGSSNTLIALEADDYTVLVTDNNGCTITKTFSVTQPASPVSVVLSGVTDVLCYGMSTGGVNIAATGGTPGYGFNWMDASGATILTTEDLTGQVAGIYSVIVSDFYGCDTTETYIIEQPLDTLMATNIVTPVVCFGESNGGVDVLTTGGTTPYSYAWTNSTYQLSTAVEDLVNFPSDTYYLVITDIHNCVFLDTFFIDQPDLLTGFTVGVDILCKNDATGEIDLTMQGGVLPYTYLWNTGPTIPDLNGLVAGDYSVVVTDTNLCQFTTAITLTEPDDTLGFSVESFPVVCHGEANGYIELDITGGTPLYSVLWSNADSLTTITDLTAGWYEFDIIDANGCQVVDSIEVFQPDLLLANEVVTDVTCFEFADGIIDISPSGGTGSYDYTWFNSVYALSSQQQDLIDFPADIYQLELRDSLGCLTELFIDLPEPEPLVVTAETVDVTCAGGTDGSIDVSVTGGNPDYTYLWTNGYTTQDLVNVPIDEYTVVVTDTKNCVDSLTIIIYEPDPIQVDFDVVQVSCADQFDGSALALPYGGTGIFTYEWSNGGTDAMIENVYGGTYIVSVMDIVGCEMSDTTFIPTDPKACINPPTAFTPNDDSYNDTWHLENIELYPDLDIKIFNRWGTLLYEQYNLYEAWNGIFHGQPIPSETYYYIINLNNSTDPLKGIVTIVR